MDLVTCGKNASLQHYSEPFYLYYMINKPFPNNLRERRLKAGLLQRDVAARLALDCADRLSRWENGSAMPNTVNLFRLAALYNVKPHELYPELYRISVTVGDGYSCQTRAPDIQPGS